MVAHVIHSVEIDKELANALKGASSLYGLVIDGHFVLAIYDPPPSGDLSGQTMGQEVCILTLHGIG